MKIAIRGIRENISTLVRKIGYRAAGPARDRKEFSAIRSAWGGDFPRFHIYITLGAKAGDFDINVHLDQKKPSYQGTSAHSGEYGGKVVEEETERIKKIFKKEDVARRTVLR